jgi:hypothetical protein
MYANDSLFYTQLGRTAWAVNAVGSPIAHHPRGFLEDRMAGQHRP